MELEELINKVQEDGRFRMFLLSFDGSSWQAQVSNSQTRKFAEARTPTEAVERLLVALNESL